MSVIIFNKSLHLKKYHFEFSKSDNIKLFNECEGYISNASFNIMLHLLREIDFDELAYIVLASNEKMLKNIERSVTRRLWSHTMTESYSLAKNGLVNEAKMADIFMKLKLAIFKSACGEGENSEYRNIFRLNEKGTLTDKIDYIQNCFPSYQGIIWDRFNNNIFYHQFISPDHFNAYTRKFVNNILVKHDYKAAIKIAAEYSILGKGNCSLSFSSLGLDENEDIYYPTFIIRNIDGNTLIYKYSQPIISYPEPFKYGGKEPEDFTRFSKKIEGDFTIVTEEFFINHCKLLENDKSKYIMF